MAPRKKVRPTAPPSAPAITRSGMGILALTLGGLAAAGCPKKADHQPPMPPPMPDPTNGYGDPPMTEERVDDAPPPMPDPSEGDMEAPMDEATPPMPAPPMPDPG